jgi:plasmid maintenance system antidote protein VapI
MKRKANYELLDAIRETGLTRQQFCEKVKMSRSLICSLINNKSTITTRTATILHQELPNFDIKKAIEENGSPVCFIQSNTVVAKMITNLIKKEMLPQNRFAMKAGIACSTVNEMLTGKKILTPHVAYRIQQAFPEFDAIKALRIQSRVLDKPRFSNEYYTKKWNLKVLSK